MNRQRGFSLIELMIAMAILGVVMFGLVATFTANQKTHVTVDQVTAVQQNLRVIAEIIEDDLRMSGYLVPGHAAVCLNDTNTGPDTLFLSDADAILSVAQIEVQDPDLLGSEFGAPIENLSSGAPVGGTGVDLVLPQSWVDLGSADDFRVGAGLMVVDRNDSEGRVVCGTITNIVPGAGNGVTLSVDFETPPVSFGADGFADIVAIPAHVYRVVVPTPGNGDRYQLRRDGVLLANDVEDIQFALFFDFDDDGVVEAGEFQGDDGSTVGDGIAIVHSPATTNGRSLKQVRLNLVIATEREDPDPNAPQSQQQVTGNREASSIPPPDRRKRRIYQSTVRLRNV
ncbi:MAG: prepilin-type N-terminal cleavage/methylation domain-containing protein [Myxococcota bacterium]